jgi:hypothetical protein
MGEAIRPSDISVVVQGAVDPKLTPKCLNSLRRHLPGAEVILSSWEGTDVSGLDFDLLVLNKDPGAIKYNETHLNNLNRQLLSTKMGLEKASRPYALKLRSDMALTGSGFLRTFDAWPARDERYALFSHRLTACLIFSTKNECDRRGNVLWRPFHVSDWWHFGRTEDVKAMFSAAPVKEPDFSRYFGAGPKPIGKPVIFPDETWRMSPEQYFLSELVRKKFPALRFFDMFDYDEATIELSERIIINNFLILDEPESGITMLKSSYRNSIRSLPCGACRQGLYTKAVWLMEYKKHCDPSFRVPRRLTFSHRLAMKYPHTRKHFFGLFEIEPSLRAPLKLLEEITGVAYYAMKESLPYQRINSHTERKW